MSKITFGCKLVSFLILASFLIYGWKITYNSVQIIYQWWQISIWWGISYIFIASLFLFLNLSAAYGLFYEKKWGFLLAYFAIIFSTFFFSYPYVPLISKMINHLFSIRHAYITLIVINLSVICYIGYLHYLYRRR